MASFEAFPVANCGAFQSAAKDFAMPAERKLALDEDLEIDVVMDEKTCTECQTIVFETLNEVVQSGRKDALKGLTIVTGKDVANVSDVPAQKLILIGNCTTQFKEHGRHVEAVRFGPMK